MNDADGDQRDGMCPSCQSGPGVPTATVISKEGRTMSYRCPACGQTWNSTHPYTGLWGSSSTK